MDNTVLLKKDGSFEASVLVKAGNKKNTSYKTKKMVFKNVWDYSNMNVEIQKGATFGSLFKALKHLEGLNELSKWCSCDLNDMFEDLATPYEPYEDKWTKIRRLEIYPTVDLSTWEKETSIDVSWGFHAKGSVKDHENETKWIEEQNISVSTCSLNELKDFPIKIKTSAELWHWDSDKKKNKTKKLMDVDVELRFDQFIRSVLWDLSFYGSRADKKKFIEEMNKRVEDVESGKAKTVPWSEIKKCLDKKLKSKKRDK